MKHSCFNMEASNYGEVYTTQVLSSWPSVLLQKNVHLKNFFEYQDTILSLQRCLKGFDFALSCFFRH